MKNIYLCLNTCLRFHRKNRRSKLYIYISFLIYCNLFSVFLKIHVIYCCIQNRQSLCIQPWSYDIQGIIKVSRLF